MVKLKNLIAIPDLSKTTNVYGKQEQYSHYLNSRNEYQRPMRFILYYVRTDVGDKILFALYIYIYILVYL